MEKFKMEQNESVKIIMEALQNIQRANPRATKDGKNAFHGYDYVSEEGLIEQVRESFIENGLLLSPAVDQHGDHMVNVGLGKDANQHLIVWVQEFHLAHISGALWPFPISVLCEGIDNGDKAVWKGLTNAHKHVLLKLLMLPTGEDPEADKSTDEAMAPQVRHTPRRVEPTSAARGGSQLPAPRKSPPSPQAANTGREEEPHGEGPDVEIPQSEFKAHRIWQMNFQAVEAVFGKPAPDDVKFSCLDDFKIQRGIGKGDPFMTSDLEAFKVFSSGGWHQFKQVAPQAPEEPMPQDDLTPF